ncbi:MAG TPA: MgtC/SapB family protein [Vicinamibacterales bacterium]
MTPVARLARAACVIAAAIVIALGPGASAAFAQSLPGEGGKHESLLTETPDTTTQSQELKHAAQRLPLAAALASMLAMRPRRRGTPARRPAVIQTQVILAVIGSVVMLVVGSSLARAFGIVGAAGLVRYRAKIEDPKDAGVMLSTLAVGLATGVGLWMLAVFGAFFILAVLWIVESFEPMAMRLFELKIKRKDPSRIKDRVERALKSARVPFELRAVGQEELHYEVRWPLERKTDRLSDEILKIETSVPTEVEWEQKSEKK